MCPNLFSCPHLSLDLVPLDCWNSGLSPGPPFESQTSGPSSITACCHQELPLSPPAMPWESGWSLRSFTSCSGMSRILYFWVQLYLSFLPRTLEIVPQQCAQILFPVRDAFSQVVCRASFRSCSRNLDKFPKVHGPIRHIVMTDCPRVCPPC